MKTTQFPSAALRVFFFLAVMSRSNVAAKTIGVRGGIGATESLVPVEEEDHSSYASANPKFMPEMAERKMRSGDDEEADRHRIFIKYKKQNKAACKHAMVEADMNRKKKGTPGITYHFEFDESNTIVIEADAEELAAMNNDPSIESMEDDDRIYLMDAVEDFVISGEEGVSPRKLREYRPWGIDAVQASDVWDQGFKGAGVKVCVIDSGIDAEHSDFVTSNLDGVDTTLAWDSDTCGHGTHVAGTIAAKDDNGGVIGVAPEAEIFVVRVFAYSESKKECAWAYNSDIMNAARICRDNGADIINMSLGGSRYSSTVNSFFTDLYNNGILPIAAAGNDGSTGLSYPASYTSVMSVAAIAENKELAGFSQQNGEVDIAAPGVNIWSTYPASQYRNLQGTSMAAPHVSGVAALLFSAGSFSASDVRAAIEDTAEDLGTSGEDNSFGHGLIQANDALQQLLSSSASDGDGNNGGEMEEHDYVVFRNKDEPDKCFALEDASTANGNGLSVVPCDATTAAQQWILGSDNYLRSTIDQNKCVVGRRGNTSSGTALMIWDCFQNDRRFMFNRYTDGSVRPVLNTNVCVGPSKSKRVNANLSSGNYIAQLYLCYGGKHQSWNWD